MTAPADSMKDWPKTLRLNAEAVWLAQKLHVAVCDFYGCPYEAWDTLSAERRGDYIHKTANLIQSMMPLPEGPRVPLFEQAVSMARAEAARVLARITPEFPYGQPVEPDIRD